MYGEQLWLWPELAPLHVEGMPQRGNWRSKDIAVMIQTRDRLEDFDRTVEMFYDTSIDLRNFDLIGVIDQDEIRKYSRLIDRYKRAGMKFIFPKPDPTWKNLTVARSRFVNATDYYFYWVMVDDILELRKGWDAAIVDKKYMFEDDIYTLVNDNDDCHGRGSFMGADHAYIPQENDRRYHRIVFEKPAFTQLLWHCDMLPISTRKWMQLLHPIIDNGDFPSQHDCITAAIVRQLKEKYNEHRCIRSGVYWKDLIDQNTTKDFSDQYGNNKDESFRKLCEKDFAKLEPTLNRFKKAMRFSDPKNRLKI